MNILYKSLLKRNTLKKSFNITCFSITNISGNNEKHKDSANINEGKIENKSNNINNVSPKIEGQKALVENSNRIKYVQNTKTRIRIKTSLSENININEKEKFKSIIKSCSEGLYKNYNKDNKM